MSYGEIDLREQEREEAKQRVREAQETLRQIGNEAYEARMKAGNEHSWVFGFAAGVIISPFLWGLGFLLAWLVVG